MTEDQLSKIYRFLELDKADGRVKLKADTMKKVIELTSKWKKGSKQEFVDKLANRTSLSTRKIRENYIEPLITEGILIQRGNGYIEFAGLPDNAEMPLELTSEQLAEELEEENEKRRELGKPKITLEEWKKTRTERKKPLEA